MKERRELGCPVARIPLDIGVIGAIRRAVALVRAAAVGLQLRRDNRRLRHGKRSNGKRRQKIPGSVRAHPCMDFGAAVGVAVEAVGAERGPRRAAQAARPRPALEVSMDLDSCVYALVVHICSCKGRCFILLLLFSPVVSGTCADTLLRLNILFVECMVAEWHDIDAAINNLNAPSTEFS